jgi:hypothetical protein
MLLEDHFRRKQKVGSRRWGFSSARNLIVLMVMSDELVSDELYLYLYL